MSDPVSLVSLFEAGEQAAVRGDFAAAARLLADAARTQEATLGPDHLDLANTLNNLAVAHERSGQLDAAEREYRRAHAIAARTLPADDPLVTTSAQNLREFCAANGRPLETSALRLADDEDVGAATTVVLTRPPQADVPTAPIEPLAITFATGPAPVAPPIAPGPAPVPSAAPAAPAAPTAAAAPAPTPTAAPIAAVPVAPTLDRAAAPAPARVAPPMPARVPGAPRSRLPIPVLVGLGAAAALVIWLFAGRGPAAPPARPEAAAPAASPSPVDPAVVTTPPSVRPAPPVTAGAAVPPSAAPPAVTPPAAAPPPAAPPAVTPPAAARPPAAVDGLTVGDAQLCTSLSSSYRCEAAGATVRSGRLTFYTRLVANQDTSVVHRWYRGDELRQAVRLQVPGRRQGFRTYSRGTVYPTAGEWRVELRSRDGRLLHTERFTVR